MEIVDNAIILVWSGAMDASIGDNRALIARWRGRVLAHGTQGHAH